MSTLNRQISEAIRDVYGNAGRPDGWAAVLQIVTQITGAGSGCIVVSRGNAPGTSVNCYTGIDPEWIAAYNAHYCQYDPSPRLMRSRPGEVLVDHVTGPRPRAATGDGRIFYHEVMAPQDFRHTLALGLEGLGAWNAGLILQRPPRLGPFGSESIEGLQQLRDHLAQALQLHARMTEAGAVGAGMAAALDRVRAGVVLLNAAEEIVWANHAAERVLAGGTALTAVGRRLAAPGTADNARLQDLMQNAIRAGLARDATAGGGVMYLRDAAPGSTVQLEVGPLAATSGGDPLAPMQAAAIVWLNPGAMKPTGSPERFEALYGLTPAEGQLLAALVEGDSLADAAERRGVGYETIRSQMKTAMHKLGVSRQSDLLRLILGGSGVDWCELEES